MLCKNIKNTLYSVFQVLYMYIVLYKNEFKQFEKMYTVLRSCILEHYINNTYWTYVVEYALYLQYYEYK